MDSNTKKIVFIKMGNFSHTNDSILKVLKIQFPSNEIIVIDVWEEIINIKSIANVANAFFEYGLKMLASKQVFIDSLVKNRYIFATVKKKIQESLKEQDILFTFQTQSLFDSSIQGVPNYMYTDHTYLINKTYPGFDLNQLEYFNDWIRLEKSIYKNASLNFTMSSNIKNSIVMDYDCPEEKVKCVYAGSNVLITNTEEIQTKKYHSKNILFVGVNWERKGGPTLQKAFEIILKKHPDATLTVVGCSPEIQVKNCNIVGKVSLEDVQQYYEKASIFCLPTTLEPFGMVFVEAMNNRLPLVATNIGAIPDFIDEDKNGYKVEPNDHMELAKKLLLLLDSPKKCEEFGKYGFENILPRYTWEYVGKEIKKNILESLDKEMQRKH